jgi:hypothetical protein
MEDNTYNPKISERILYIKERTSKSVIKYTKIKRKIYVKKTHYTSNKKEANNEYSTIECMKIFSFK